MSCQDIIEGAYVARVQIYRGYKQYHVEKECQRTFVESDLCVRLPLVVQELVQQPVQHVQMVHAFLGQYNVQR